MGAEGSDGQQLLRAPLFDGRPRPSRARIHERAGIANAWAIRGVPTALERLETLLSGRTLVLSQGGVIAARHSAPLHSPARRNPFPTPAGVFLAMAGAMSLGLNHAIEIATPFLEWDKAAVVRRGVELGVPFELTLSCMSPMITNALPQHCGLCSKCRERRDAFAAAQVRDASTYANRAPR